MRELLIIRDAQKFKEASEPSRKKILQLLSVKDMSVDELAKILEKDVSTIYRHINRLEAAGFVEIAKEEQIGSVSRRYYRRAARIIIGLLQPDETSENKIIEQVYSGKIRKGLLTLRAFRYNIPENETSLNELTKIAFEWEKLWDRTIDTRITEEKTSGDIWAYDVALNLLALIETRKNPSLRKATERLVSELAKWREQ